MENASHRVMIAMHALKEESHDEVPPSYTGGLECRGLQFGSAAFAE
jgi:hypothetical protein